jgi:predicted transcriptional regulator
MSEKTLTVRMPAALYEKMARLAQDRACNVSTLVRQLALEEVERKRKIEQDCLDRLAAL